LKADVLSASIAKLREAKEKAEIELRALAPPNADSEAPDAAALLARLPDPGQALRDAPPAIKRQVFDAFGL